MEKIEINKDACIGCGQCVHRHPEYIAFDENGQAEPVGKEIKPEDKKEFLETIEICPTEALQIFVRFFILNYITFLLLSN